MDDKVEPVEIDDMICYPKEKAPPAGGPPQESEDMSKGVEFKTCPKDPRFQQSNVTKWCYQMFIDYHRCIFLLGPKPECNYFKRCYTSICPNGWIEKWQDQIEEGTFPRDLRRDYYYRDV